MTQSSNFTASGKIGFSVTTPTQSGTSRRNFFNLPTLFLLLTWAVLYLPRPFLLGLYGDDWSGVLTWGNLDEPQRFRHFYYYYSERPLLGAFYYLVQFICRRSVFAYQTFAIFLALINALLLRKLFQIIARQLNGDHQWAPALAAAVWLAIPWMHGSIAWVSGSLNTFCQIFFSLTAIFLVSSRSLGHGRLFVASLLLLVSYWTYEQFYLQYLVLIALLFIPGRQPAFNRKDLIRTFFYLSSVQGFVVLWNRWMAYLHMGNPKTLAANYWETFMQSIFLRTPRLLQALPETTDFYLNLLVLLPSVAALGLLCLLFQKQKRKSGLGCLYIYLLGYVGYLLGMFILSFSANGPFPMGTSSRYSMNFSYWYTFLFFALIFLVHAIPKAGRLFQMVFAFLFIITLGIPSWNRTMEWHKAGILQQEVMDALPLEKVSSASEGAEIIYICPFLYPTDIPVWGGFNDFTTAVYQKILSLRQDHLRSMNQIKINFRCALPYWDVTWDGEKLKFVNTDNHNYLDYEFATREVWVFDYQNKSFEKASPGLEIQGSKLITLGGNPS